MKPLLISVVIVVFLLGVDAVLARATDTPSESRATNTSAQARTTPTCVPAPPTRWNDGSVVGPGGTALRRNGFVHLRACEPGTLRLQLRGRANGDLGARVVVSLHTQRLWEGTVTDQRTVEVVVPDAGWITVALVNATVTGGGDRRLWIDAMEFVSRSR